jgi:hypothetical protein
MAPLEELQHQVLEHRREIAWRQQELDRMQQALLIANVSARVMEDITSQQRETDRVRIQALLAEAADMNYIPASLLRRSAPVSLGEDEASLLESLCCRLCTML